MLKPPYERYQHLFVYNFNTTDIGDVDDPDLIGTWIEDDTAILFFHHEKKELVDSICKRQGVEIIYQADLDYRDWEAGLDITSFSVPPLGVTPVWEKNQRNETNNRIDIVLDPSVIFGSGFHPTTRLCLQTLVDLYQDLNRTINSVIDFGTGTGLLSIAAAKLGAQKVASYDNNPFACDVARKNVHLNNCQDSVDIQQTDLLIQLPPVDSDLIICNLYKGLLIHLFNNEQFWNASYYLISGFIPSMEEEMLSALPMENLKLVDRQSSGNWRLWLLENNKPHMAADIK